MRDPTQTASSDVRVWPQHVGDALDGLSGAFFLPVPKSLAAANVYRLDQELRPSVLQVAVDRDSASPPAGLLVRVDDRPPTALELVPREPLCATDVVPAAQDAALAQRRRQSGAFSGLTWGGDVSRGQCPAPLIPVATVELPLPVGTREIRVWSPSVDGELRVALQVLASRPFQLSEMQYLEMQRRAEADWRLFLATLKEQPLASPDDDAARELHNHWLPLLRLLRAWRRPSPSPSARRPPHGPQPPPLDQSRLQQLAARARQYAADGQWPSALEAWSEVLPHAPAELRREAILCRMHALQQQPGEAFLAKSYLRGLFLYDDDPQVRQTAYERLRESAADPEQRLQLCAAVVCREGSVVTLRELAVVLAEAGRYGEALDVALVIPASERPTEVLLRSAFQRRWWHVFDRTAAALSDVAVRRYWQGLRALDAGRQAEALAALQQAGAPGQAVATYWEQGEKIAARLAGDDPLQHTAAARDWHRWWSAHPGPHVWREAPELVVDYPAAQSLYAPELDAHVQSYLARPDDPVVVRVRGPARLKCEVRLLHPAGAEDAIDDCLQISGKGWDCSLAIMASRATPALRPVGDISRVPGRKAEKELTVGPGLHRLELAGRTHDMLLRVFASRPEVPLGPLPPPTAAAAAQVGPQALAAEARAAADDP